MVLVQSKQMTSHFLPIGAQFACQFYYKGSQPSPTVNYLALSFYLSSFFSSQNSSDLIFSKSQLLHRTFFCPSPWEKQVHCKVENK